MGKNIEDHVIVDLVLSYKGLDKDKFYSGYRKPPSPDARIICAILMQFVYSKQMSNEEIEYVIRRSGYTGYVTYANKRFRDLMDTDSKFMTEYNNIKMHLISAYPEIFKSQLKYSRGDKLYFYPEYNGLPKKAKLIDYNIDKRKWVCEDVRTEKLYFVAEYELFGAD